MTIEWKEGNLPEIGEAFYHGKQRKVLAIKRGKKTRVVLSK